MGRPGLAKSSGEEGEPILQRRRSCARRRSLIAGRLRWGRPLASIGHQPNIHTAVFRAADPGFIRLARLFLAPPHLVNLLARESLLLTQVLTLSCCPAPAPTLVVVRRA